MFAPSAAAGDLRGRGRYVPRIETESSQVIMRAKASGPFDGLAGATGLEPANDAAWRSECAARDRAGDLPPDSRSDRLRLAASPDREALL